MNDTETSARVMSADDEKLRELLKGHESRFPWKTSAQFPHIIERLAALWLNPPALRTYLQQLLLTQRETREGFPFEVYAELDSLTELYDLLHPLTKKIRDNFWTWV